MKYLTRLKLQKLLLKSKKKLYKLLPNLLLETYKVYNNKYEFKINYNHINNVLQNKNIEFFCLINGHWAETDCKKIWLNTYKLSNHKLNNFIYTLMHEAIHGLILYRKSAKEIYYLNEWREHQIMGNCMKELI